MPVDLTENERTLLLGLLGQIQFSQLGDTQAVLLVAELMEKLRDMDQQTQDKPVAIGNRQSG
jgi:hypothetical protein